MFMGGDDLENWARDASPGASVCLGVASAVPASVQPALRSLSDAGVIDIARRKVGPERYSFVVQRRSARFVAPSPVVTPRRGGNFARRAGTIERRILRLLLKAAAHNLPCPTNASIASLVGLRDEVGASYRLRRLQQRGLIRVEVPGDPRQLRVVTICASGKQTRSGWRRG